MQTQKYRIVQWIDQYENCLSQLEWDCGLHLLGYLWIFLEFCRSYDQENATDD